MANDKKINLEKTTEYRNLLKEINFLKAQEEQTGEKIVGAQQVWIDNAEKIIKEYKEMDDVSGDVADTSKDILKIMTKLIDPTTKNRKELEKILGVKVKQGGIDEDIADSINDQVKATKNLNEEWNDFLKQQKASSGAADNVFSTMDAAIGGIGGKFMKFLFNPITILFALFPFFHSPTLTVLARSTLYILKKDL